ncbi:glycosyltransferase family 2 protein [Oscillatoria sp. FACHB-1407]|nr:glycosyltransferase family 2 protein [Oscillatoria sp. FACHB-1407]
MSLDFTVAIPTFNGAKRLPALLERLRSLTNPGAIAWEILIVDNNSNDDTAQVIADYQANWNYPFALRYCFEPEQGAAFARQRAVREAQGDLIGFLDDDNLPAPDWLTAAHTFAIEHPEAGAFSGQIHGEFEVEPPENFRKIQPYLAIRGHGSAPRLFSPPDLRLPPAACLIVRKQVWLDSVPARQILTGKRPGVLVQGEDYEPLLYIYKAGWEIWYTPTLHTYHQIPKWRFERDYLLAVARGNGLATCQLRMILAQPWEKPIIFVRTLLGNLRRVCVHTLKYRNQLKTELVPAFELEFFWGSLLSPFYFLKLNLQNKSSRSHGA